MLSLADTSKYYQVLLAQGIGRGIGGGMVLPPAVSVQAQHWKKRRSLAMGVTFTGMSLSNCHASSSHHLEPAYLLNFASSSIFDVLVVALTIYRTGRLAYKSWKNDVKGSLSLVLLRDGM